MDTLLRQHVEPVAGSLFIANMTLDWPDDTPVSNDDIQEYVGDPQDIARFVAGAQVVITQVAPINRDLIEQAPNLELIAPARGGPVNVNVSAATAAGIPVLFAPGTNARAVAEYTLGLILTECKGIARAHCSMTAGEWQPAIYHYAASARELHRQTIGLIGFGHIGRLLAPLLHAFEMRVLIYDPYVPDEDCAALGVIKVDLPSLLRESDVVSLHARVTPETRGMMGAEQFAAMKPDAYFINTARGSLVDYDALYTALSGGHLAGAALDTFAVEPPPPDWPLLKLDNVTLTPHVAGASRETARRKAETVIIDIANYYAGRPIHYCANPETLAQ
jgi:D-3-phosphoglycerate dehydrogenase / 2-oxoglutarate reductase